MSIFGRRAEARREEDLRSAYPEAWAMGEHLANFQFRDFVYLGVDPSSTRQEWSQLRRRFLPEAQARFLSMKGLSGDQVDPFALQAFGLGFGRRLEKLLEAYSISPDAEDPMAATTDAFGMLHPGSPESLIAEGRRAAFLDDPRGGPIFGLGMQAEAAAQRLRGKGATDEMSLEELASIDAESVSQLLAVDVFRGTVTLEEALEVVPEAEDDLRAVADLREGRLRGGPLPGV